MAEARTTRPTYKIDLIAYMTHAAKAHKKQLRKAFSEQAINKSVRNYDNSDSLKINLFTDNERYFLNQVRKLEKEAPPEEQIDLTKFNEYIYAEYKERSECFRVSLMEKFPVIASAFKRVLLKFDRRPDEPNSDASSRIFNGDRYNCIDAAFELNKTTAKRLKPKYPSSAQKIDHLTTGLANFKNYDRDAEIFGLDYLSAMETMFIEGFVTNKILPLAHSALSELVQNLHKDDKERIEATGLEIEVQSGLTFLGRLSLSRLDAQKLEAYLASQESAVQNAAGVGFVQSPISQPVPNQQTTNTTVTTTNTTSTTTTTTTTSPERRI